MDVKREKSKTKKCNKARYEGRDNTKRRKKRQHKDEEDVTGTDNVANPRTRHYREGRGWVIKGRAGN